GQRRQLARLRGIEGDGKVIRFQGLEGLRSELLVNMQLQRAMKRVAGTQPPVRIGLATGNHKGEPALGKYVQRISDEGVRLAWTRRFVASRNNLVHFLRDPRAHQQHGRLNGNADHRHVPEDAEVKLRVEMKMDVVIILEARHVAPKLEDAVEYTILQRFSRR